jgi:hypothetical protein
MYGSFRMREISIKARTHVWTRVRMCGPDEHKQRCGTVCNSSWCEPTHLRSVAEREGSVSALIELRGDIAQGICIQKASGMLEARERAATRGNRHTQPTDNPKPQSHRFRPGHELRSKRQNTEGHEEAIAGDSQTSNKLATSRSA